MGAGGAWVCVCSRLCAGLRLAHQPRVEGMWPNPAQLVVPANGLSSPPTLGMAYGEQH